MTNSNENTDYQSYLEYRHQAVQGEGDQISKYDRSIFMLASGAIALSISFLDSLVSPQITKYVYLIVSSWSLFLFSILCVVASHLTSSKSFHFDLNQIDKRYGNDSYEWQTNPWNQATGVLNIVSGIAFFLVQQCSLFFPILTLGDD